MKTVYIYEDIDPITTDMMDTWTRIYLDLDEISEESYREAIN